MRTTAVAHLAFAVTLSFASLAALALPGCGGDTLVCDPECPAGFTCTETGCVADNQTKPDLTTEPRPDMAGSCPVNCSGSTPYCKGNVCVPCLTDDNCAKGQICMTVGNSTACVPGCTDDTRCAANQKCCKGLCTDVQTDVANCGACGNVCGGQHSSAKCVAGVCGGGACASGWGDCNKDAKDGCEVNLFTDPNNCTACGMKCSVKNAIAGCSGVDKNPCFIAACIFGYDDCNGDLKDGCETSVLSDIKNCGACGTPCANKPNAQVSCINAQCQLTSCVQGYLDCNGDPKDGCEVNIATDANNCGGCKLACSPGLVCKGQQCTCPMCNIPNASAKCINNVCVFDKCNPGYTDCNNNPADGCEVVTDSDAKNCGSCGNVCPNNLPACVSGMCSNSTHNIMVLNWDFSGGAGGCGDFSIWYTQNFGAMTWDQCELLANKYGAQYIGSPTIYAYMAPYIATVRWAGEADANNGYISANAWNSQGTAMKNTQQACILGYANDKLPGKGTFPNMMQSNNGKAYFVADMGAISEKVCYTAALANGARPLNPWMFANAAKATAHLIENHSCHGSTEYTGAPGYMSDGGANHTYKCFIGYNP